MSWGSPQTQARHPFVHCPKPKGAGDDDYDGGDSGDSGDSDDSDDSGGGGGGDGGGGKRRPMTGGWLVRGLARSAALLPRRLRDMLADRVLPRALRFFRRARAFLAEAWASFVG